MYPNSVKDCLHNLSLSENNNIVLSEDKRQYYKGLIVGLLSGLNQRMNYDTSCKMIRENLPEDCIDLSEVVPMFVDDIYKAKVHYIALGGLSGCLPNFCDVCIDKSSAYDYIGLIHDLSASYIRKLAGSDGYIPLNLHKHGNEYAEIIECDCNHPEDHQDTYLDRHSFYLNNPEFYE